MYYVSFLFLSLSQLHYRWSKTNRGTLTDASVGFGVPYPHQEKDSTLRCWKQYKSALNHGILRRLFQRKKSIEVALVEPILNNSIFLKLCFGINLRLLCAALILPGPVSNSFPLNSKNPSSRFAQSSMLIGILRSVRSSAQSR